LPVSIRLLQTGSFAVIVSLVLTSIPSLFSAKARAALAGSIELSAFVLMALVLFGLVSGVVYRLLDPYASLRD
jgi:hypothetical protein